MYNDNLSELELERYHRQMALPHFGTEGQLRLKQASVLVVGVGGLGSIASLYLAAAGVGNIGLIEDDHVSLDNLHRQILYTTDEVGKPKLALATSRLRALNPEVILMPFSYRFNKDNADAIVRDFDLVVDGTDNLETRRLINQTCVALGKPYIFGAVNLYDGQMSVFYASQGPCWACLFPENPQPIPITRPNPLPIFNTVPAVIGVLQATEAIKWIVGVGNVLLGQLLIYNALDASFTRVSVEKNPNCPVCGDKR